MKLKERFVQFTIQNSSSLDIKECAVAERKRRYTDKFLVLKVWDSGKAKTASPYVWFGLSYRVKSVHFVQFARLASN